MLKALHKFRFPVRRIVAAAALMVLFAQALVPTGFMLASDANGQLVLIPCPSQGEVITGVDAGLTHQHLGHTDSSGELPVASPDNTCGFALASAPAIPTYTVALLDRLDAGSVYIPAVRNVQIAASHHARRSARGPPQHA